ncbi:MAG: hypothetical protein AVDCRST_MAG73-3787, partial [uncultured Thermomicrobiales bacterium]
GRGEHGGRPQSLVVPHGTGGSEQGRDGDLSGEAPEPPNPELGDPSPRSRGKGGWGVRGTPRQRRFDASLRRSLDMGVVRLCRGARPPNRLRPRPLVHPGGAVFRPGMGRPLLPAGRARAPLDGRGDPGVAGLARDRRRSALAAPAVLPADGTGGGGDPRGAGRDHDDLYGEPPQPVRAEPGIAGERGRGADRGDDRHRRVFVHHRGLDPGRRGGGDRAGAAGARLRAVVRGGRAGHLRRHRPLLGRGRPRRGPLRRRRRGRPDAVQRPAPAPRPDDSAGLGRDLGVDPGLHREADQRRPGRGVSAGVPAVQRRPGDRPRLVHRPPVRLCDRDRRGDGRGGLDLRLPDPGGDPGPLDPVQPRDRVPAADRADRPPADSGDDVRAAGPGHGGYPAARSGRFRCRVPPRSWAAQHGGRGTGPAAGDGV